jgi:hypothetical protein
MLRRAISASGTASRYQLADRPVLSRDGADGAVSCGPWISAALHHGRISQAAFNTLCKVAHDGSQ